MNEHIFLSFPTNMRILKNLELQFSEKKRTGLPEKNLEHLNFSIITKWSRIFFIQFQNFFDRVQKINEYLFHFLFLILKIQCLLHFGNL
jgi:hypothetical protein